MTRVATVSITFLTSIEGGRSQPPDLEGGRYRPTVRVIGWPSEQQVGVVLEDGVVASALGVRVEARLVPILASAVWEEMLPGAEFEVREGEKVVGFGVVRSTSSESEIPEPLLAEFSPVDDSAPVVPWKLPVLDEPKGLGGWLLFFLVVTAARSFSMMFGAIASLAQMVDHPGSEAVLSGFALASLALGIYSAWVTSAFWRLRSNAVRLLPAYFTCLLAYGLAVFGLPLVGHDPSSTSYLARAGRSGLSALVYVGVWTAYFKTSRRVANTFGPSGVVA